MSRKTLGYGGVAVVLLIFIGSLTGVIYQQSKGNAVNMNEELEENLSVAMEDQLNEEVSSENQNTEAVSDPGENEEVKKVIAASHKTLNVAVGWEGHRNFSWANKSSELLTLLANTKSLLDDVTETQLEQDVLNVMACIEKAIEDQDVEGVILAHRIMHDLDYYINGNEADGILYFVTHFGNSQNVEDLYTFIH